MDSRFLPVFLTASGLYTGNIRINKPAHSGSLFYNYKRYFSLILIAISDADYRFISIDVGAYGKCSYSTVFKDSVFYEKLVNGQLNIPGKCPISAVDPKSIPHVLTGDEAFPLSQNLMRPYFRNNFSIEKRIFNYRLSWARRYVECSFGIFDQTL
jgi:hypothetical protein